MTYIPIEYQLKPFILLILLVNLVTLNIIFGKTNENIANKREVIAFKGMLVSFMVYSFVDLRLLIGDAFYTAFHPLFVRFVVSVGFGTMTFACFFWFMHVYASIHPSSKAWKLGSINIWNVLIHIPLLIVMVLLFTPLYIHVYELTDTIAVFKPLLLLILLLDYVYLISATAISIYKLKTSKTKPEKKKHGSQIIFILFFTASGILIGFLLNLPAIELLVIPVVLKLFVELQDSQIYTDALTKLYNRRKMTEFINEEISTCNHENPLTIIMIDLDFFKSINDILGHDEGDKALVTFSHALLKVTRSRNAVASRWGGDEFVVAGKEPDIGENFRDLLSAALEEVNTLPYMPQFSIGSYSCTSPQTTYEKAMVMADDILYTDKEKQHKNADEFISQLKAIKRTNNLLKPQ